MGIASHTTWQRGRSRTLEKNMWQIIKETSREWSEDKVPRLSAALAFYTMLSLAPLLIITLKIITFFVGKEKSPDQVANYVGSISSAQTAETVRAIFEQQARQPASGALASLVSLVILLFAASGAFGELQTSMNEVWELKPRPNRGIMATIKDRFFSMTLVFGVAFLLLVSLIISTVISTLSNKLMPGQSFLWQAINLIVSIAIIACLFALIFKHLPDAKVDWKYVWIGGAVTSVLFAIGKWGLGIYLAKGSTASIYGTMGSLVALLIWVYYSAQIFFIGAELVQVCAAHDGHPIRPDEKAMPIDEDEKSFGGVSAAKEETWYPAVPVRRELAVAPGYAGGQSRNGGSGAGSKILMLAAGVAVGKFLLGGSAKGGGRKVDVVKIVEPGFVSRRKLHENKEYVVRFRPPKFIAKAADTVQRGYRKVKNRIAEYIES